MVSLISFVIGKLFLCTIESAISGGCIEVFTFTESEIKTY